VDPLLLLFLFSFLFQKNTDAYGQFVVKDLAKALRYLTKAAAKDHVFAILRLAEVYHLGISPQIAVNLPMAVQWYQRAAALGNAEAHAELARLYLPVVNDGPILMARDDQKAAYHLHAALKQNDPLAQLSLSECYLRGWLGYPVDHEKRLFYLQASAAQGNTRAQTLLGATLLGYHHEASERAAGRHWLRTAVRNPEKDPLTTPTATHFNILVGSRCGVGVR
jgi:TPR repeat protein